jgi:hypothetical protein
MRGDLLHGKEGVSGSSPDVGLPQKPHNRELLHAPGKLGAFFLRFLGRFLSVMERRDSIKMVRLQTSQA